MSQRTYPGLAKRERFTFEELLDLCLRNAANSYSVFEMESTAIPGVGPRAVTRPSLERYKGNLGILWAHILEREKDEQFDKDIKGIKDSESERFHHAIIELLDRRQFFAHKVPRTLID